MNVLRASDLTVQCSLGLIISLFFLSLLPFLGLFISFLHSLSLSLHPPTSLSVFLYSLLTVYLGMEIGNGDCLQQYVSPQWRKKTHDSTIT